MPGFNISVLGCNDENAFKEDPAFKGPSNLLETGRDYRFSLDIFEPFGGREDGILLYLEKCERPSIEIDEIVIHNGQDEIYRPGKMKWKPISFTFYEVLKGEDSPNDNNTAGKIFELWSEKVLDLFNSRISPPNDLASDAQLSMLNGKGDPVWIYDMYRCWPTKVSPSDLDNSSNGISKITVTMRYDKARER